jgi:antitoxin component YwqK of YwqJK toxin-antitoxin module
LETGNREYEGIWKAGKIDQKGIMFDINNVPRYEGAVKDGKRNGAGVSFYWNKQKEYEGEWVGD